MENGEELREGELAPVERDLKQAEGTKSNWDRGATHGEQSLAYKVSSFSNGKSSVTGPYGVSTKAEG